MRILIIGGTGDTGSWFARYFKEKDHEVWVWGPSHKTDLAREMGVEFAHDLDDAIPRCDVLMISVPIDKTTQVIHDLAPKMKQGLLMDVTSMKEEPVRAMREYAPENVEVLGTHPMFGPSMPTIREQTVIITPNDRIGPIAQEIIGMFREDGARVETLSPEEHDRMMAVVQGLTHFAYIGIGCALESLDFDVEGSRRFVSPVYEIMLDFVGRILAQNPHLYSMIQGNPHASKTREVFIKACRELADNIEAGDFEAFEERMHRAAEHFKDTESAHERSDEIINTKIRRE